VVQPLLPSLRHGGKAQVVGEQAVRVTWRAGERRLILDANLSLSPVAFPRLEIPSFWLCGDAGAAFGPWAVRWGLDSE
jgi:hypothetical protein